jgi:hypothetical protein
MRKICSFTQTYSDERAELFEYRDKDLSDISFRNQFDSTFYAFHNSSEPYIAQLLGGRYFEQIKNLETIRYQEISYPESFRRSLELIAKNNYDYVIFLQDDCLTLQDIDQELIDFIKHEDFDMLNLETTPRDLNVSREPIYADNNFTVTDTKSSDFANRNLYAFDDGAYAARVSFLLDVLYDDNYYKQANVWNGEVYLEHKIRRSPIQRLTTNKNYYRRYNILGRNAHDRSKHLVTLKERFR